MFALGPDSLKGGGLELTISDDGVGFEETEVSKRQGTGLVRRLLEQIGGTATRSSDHGTKWLLKVPKHRIQYSFETEQRTAQRRNETFLSPIKNTSKVAFVAARDRPVEQTSGETTMSKTWKAECRYLQPDKLLGNLELTRSKS